MFAGDSSVVDEDIDGPILLQRGGHERFALLVAPDITADGEAAPSALQDGLLCRQVVLLAVRGDIGQDDGEAITCQLPGDRSTDAGG